MKEGTPNHTVTAPLAKPMNAAAAMARTTASRSGIPASSAKRMLNAVRANTMPTERSISPRIMSMTSPAAMIAAAAMNCARVRRLVSLRNCSDELWK